jgi:hypothetical protein
LIVHGLPRAAALHDLGHHGHGLLAIRGIHLGLEAFALDLVAAILVRVAGVAADVDAAAGTLWSWKLLAAGASCEFQPMNLE